MENKIAFQKANREGGENFSIIMSSTSLSNVKNAAKLLESWNGNNQMQHNVKVGVGVGRRRMYTHNEELKEVLKRNKLFNEQRKKLKTVPIGFHLDEASPPYALLN